MPLLQERAWLHLTPHGIYCEPGNFYIDPWRPVEKALITHAHSDHARYGSRFYLTAQENLPLLRHRLGDVYIEGWAWGEERRIGEVAVAFYPAGHIRGASQIRLSYKGEVWVITGDYKRHSDPTTAAFEPLKAHGVISECTFGLPIYQWASPEHVLEEIAAWWQKCASEGKNAVLYAYSLGKAQRLLASLPEIGPVVVHGALTPINKLYEAGGVRLLPWKPAANLTHKVKGALVLAPPAVQKSAWLRRFEPYEEGQASGWMAIRGRRRQKALDRGFPLSDHADYYQLLQTLREMEVEKVIFTHGYTEVMRATAAAMGWEAHTWQTLYQGEGVEEEERTREDSNPQPPDP
ncbi:MAG: ligase-associated DNA damage response exonuclease [Bacteroidia bacterium]|nr:ligase-associated DNA damage response exonuclease [Bacteroidia bacterium]